MTESTSESIEMLPCEQVATMVFDYVENDLDDVAHRQVAYHLDNCPDCSEFVRTYAAVGQLVADALEVEVDDALQAELDAAIFAAIEKSA